MSNKIKKVRDYKQAQEAAARLEPFDHVSCSGRWLDQGAIAPAWTLMPEWARYYMQDALDESGMYVVYSYGTPILWITEGMALAPAVHYSRTTDQQVARFRHALGQAGYGYCGLERKVVEVDRHVLAMLIAGTIHAYRDLLDREIPEADPEDVASLEREYERLVRAAHAGGDALK